MLDVSTWHRVGARQRRLAPHPEQREKQAQKGGGAGAWPAGACTQPTEVGHLTAPRGGEAAGEAGKVRVLYLGRFSWQWGNTAGSPVEQEQCVRAMLGAKRPIRTLLQDPKRKMSRESLTKRIWGKENEKTE